MKTKESCDQHQNKNESIGIAEHSSQDYHAISNLADKLLKVEKDAQELKMMDGTYFFFKLKPSFSYLLITRIEAGTDADLAKMVTEELAQLDELCSLIQEEVIGFRKLHF